MLLSKYLPSLLNNLNNRFITTLTSIQINQNNNSNLLRLINNYKKYGHIYSKLDPLDLNNNNIVESNELNVDLYNLDLNKNIPTEGLVSMNKSNATISEIINHLKSSYTNNIGVEIEHIDNIEERDFISAEIEKNVVYSPANKKNFYYSLLRSEVLDHFMQIKFGSFKRYGCEGEESMLLAVDTVLKTASQTGIKDVVIGMPHRGRLNLLVSLLEYPARGLFAKVKGLSLIPNNYSGECDVASHIAHSVTKKFDGVNSLNVSLIHNPSHLEAINPVSAGKVRAKMDIIDTPKEDFRPNQSTNSSDALDSVLCLQLHGDAAFAGQGVVAETLMMSNLKYYTVGGTVHIIVNNQIGYTTMPFNSRSTRYSSDVAKQINAPILHVNADSPEDVAKVCTIAANYRKKFKKDIFVDLIGFRKYGHNEVDEPSFTQPLMYNNIRSRESVVSLYAKKLVQEELMTVEDQDKVRKSLHKRLEDELNALSTFDASTVTKAFTKNWAGYDQSFSTLSSHSPKPPSTGLPISTLIKIGNDSVQLPADFSVHGRLTRTHIDARKAQVNNDKQADWATAEAMAFGSILLDGNDLRLSGQDVQRGTFSQRHATFTDQKTEALYTPFNHMTALPSSNVNPGKAHICNSPLSEFAVLGFEYGYSIESPNTLCMWEAQFGDFYNGAQIAIDTFIFSSETKWLRSTGLVMILPHGYDGAGPEHSSSHVERFLQLAADDNVNFKESTPVSTNMTVVWPSTPAQYFHMLRRQMSQKSRKPSLVVAPKTLLRDPRAVSNLEDMIVGTSFQVVLGDTHKPDSNNKVKRSSNDTVDSVVITSGKMWYDIDKDLNEKNKIDNVASIRIEQISPFPYQELAKELSNYPNLKKVIIAQEEPSSAGTYSFILPRVHYVLKNSGRNDANKLSKNIHYVGRLATASPATGVGIVHKKEVEKLYRDLHDSINKML